MMPFYVVVIGVVIAVAVYVLADALLNRPKPEPSGYVCVTCGEEIHGPVWELARLHDDSGMETWGGGTLTFASYCGRHAPSDARVR